jgi:hypothetical protein
MAAASSSPQPPAIPPRFRQVVECLGPRIVRVLGAPPQVFAEALLYFRIRALAAPAAMITAAALGVFRCGMSSSSL